jgi:hypothetical protein
MHCVEFERRLNELLDDRLPLDSDLELAAHADECGQCAELLAGHELLLRGMAALCCDADDHLADGRRKPALVPADLAVRVAAQVGGAHPRRLSPWWMLPALAASVLIAAAVYNGAHAKPASKDATSDLSKEVAHSPVENPTSLTADRWQPWLKQLGDGRDQWMDQVADGLKPVTDSMSAALHALRRTLPGAESGVRSSWSPAARSGEFVA